MYHVGTVTGPYYFEPSGNLPQPPTGDLEQRPHREVRAERRVEASIGIGTVSNVTKFSAEIEGLLDGSLPPELVAADPTVEDVSTFALEKHLEDFLVANWAVTELGKHTRSMRWTAKWSASSIRPTPAPLTSSPKATTAQSFWWSS
jgi:restriction system protein